MGWGGGWRWRLRKRNQQYWKTKNGDETEFRGGNRKMAETQRQSGERETANSRRVQYLSDTAVNSIVALQTLLITQ